MNDRSRTAARWLSAPLVLVALIFVLAGCGGDDGDQRSQATTTTTLFVMPVANDTCLTCHTDFEERIADEDPRDFSHDLHLKQRLNCETCHAPLGHGGPPMPDQKVCDDCHGVPMPHPEDYEQQHGKEVAAEGDEACSTCHNVYLHCQFCHGVQMPHPEEWEQKHGEVALPEMQTCSRCHDEYYCLRCHAVAMPHPADWTKSHGPDVVVRGSAVCTECHEPQLCVACHGVEMPHPEDWGTVHPRAVGEKREECMLCHDEADCADCHEIHQTHGKGGGA